MKNKLFFFGAIFSYLFTLSGCEKFTHEAYSDEDLINSDCMNFDSKIKDIRIRSILRDIYNSEKKNKSDKLRSVADKYQEMFIECPSKYFRKIEPYSKYEKNKISISFLRKGDNGFLILAIDLLNKSEYRYDFFEAIP